MTYRPEKADLSAIPVFCAVCAAEVPEERRRFKAVTCSKDHQKIRLQSLRNRSENRKCKYCMRPATREQQGLFKQWRWLQKYAREAPALPQLVAGLKAETIMPELDKRDRRTLLRLLDRVMLQNQPYEFSMDKDDDEVEAYA